MLKNKRVLITLLLLVAVLLIPNMVKATNESPIKSSEISSATKAVKVTLTEISLDESKEYKFGVSKVKATEPTEWLDLQDVSQEQCIAVITPENKNMRPILRSNDKCYLFIKNVTDDEITITTQVELPATLDIKRNNYGRFEINYLYEDTNTIHENLGNYQIAAVKIDNKDIIKKYLSAKENNQNTMEAVKNLLPTNKPATWSTMSVSSASDSAEYYDNLTKYEGLYMIWGQVSYKEGRAIYGYTLYDNYPNGYKLPEDDKPNTDNSDTDTDTKEPDTTPDTKKPDATPDTPKTTDTKKDTTVAPGNMPYTGGTFAIILTAIGIIAIGVYAYKRNNDLKGI